MPKNSSLLRTVNSTGFVFQVGVRHLVEGSSQRHGWRVLTEEHHWVHPESGEEGFADLVLQSASLVVRLVVECKRARDCHWVFLTPREYSRDSDDVSIFSWNRQANKRDVADWLATCAQPKTPVSAFCCVPGQSDRQTPTLERIAGTLLSSTEAIALEELRIAEPCGTGKDAFFMPVLVTNSRLFSCEFEAKNVDLNSGDIDAPEFKEVPYVRFRKALASHWPSEETSGSLEKANQLSQRSVLVVNVRALSQFLENFNLTTQFGSQVASLLRRRREG